MKKILLILLWLPLALALSAQNSLGDTSADAHIRNLTSNYWTPLSACLTVDQRELYLSMRSPNRPTADLYRCIKEKGQWQQPVLLNVLSTGGEELSPTLSPDGLTIYFIRKEQKNAGTKNEHTESNIFSAVRLPGEDWQPATQMPVAMGYDERPTMLLDGVTLLYNTSLEENSKRPVIKRYYIKKLDKYNWTLPQEVTETVTPQSLQEHYLFVTGTVREALHQQVSDATIDIYDAITQQRVATYTIDNQGAIRFILLPGRRYKVDIYRKGYSHVYEWIDCTKLDSDKELSLQPLLTPELRIHLRTYDRDNMSKLSPSLVIRQQDSQKLLTEASEKNTQGDQLLHLPIGNIYELTLSQNAYADTTFIIDTDRDVRFADTELDMLMRAAKVNALLRTTDGATGDKLTTQITLQNLSQEEEPQQIELPNGEARRTLRCATRYKLHCEATGYLYKDTIVELPGQETTVTIEIPLAQLQKEAVIQLRNIQFEYGSHLLREDSYEELHLVAELLRQNPNMRIELSAHTDNSGSDNFNLKLSDRRANSAAQYLIEQEGIDSDRLIPRGYGKTRPLVPNDTDENRAVNRRVEFSILDL